MNTVKGLHIKEEYLILHKHGYYNLVYKLYQSANQPTLKQCYYDVEKILQERFGLRRYISYESFKDCKKQYFQKLKKEKEKAAQARAHVAAKNQMILFSK